MQSTSFDALSSLEGRHRQSGANEPNCISSLNTSILLSHRFSDVIGKLNHIGHTNKSGRLKFGILMARGIPHRAMTGTVHSAFGGHCMQYLDSAKEVMKKSRHGKFRK